MNHLGGKLLSAGCEVRKSSRIRQRKQAACENSDTEDDPKSADGNSCTQHPPAPAPSNEPPLQKKAKTDKQRDTPVWTKKKTLDYFCATETWHCRSDEPFLVSATPNGYTYEEEFRPNCYEGVVIYHQRSVNTVKLNLPQYQTIQCVGVKSRCKSKEYAVVCVYHAPHYGCTAQFSGELRLVRLSQARFHIHFCDRRFKRSSRFAYGAWTSSPLHTYEVFLRTNLRQNVKVSTHKHGHILDVVLSSEHCTVTRLTVHRRTVSDHSLITFGCQLRTNPRKKKVCSRVCPSISHTPLLYVTDLSILKRNGPFDLDLEKMLDILPVYETLLVSLL